MAQFPLDPKLAKVIIAAKDYKCSEEVIRYCPYSAGLLLNNPHIHNSIVALLSVENIFFTPAKLKEKADRARLKFQSPDGDFGMLLNVFKQYKVADSAPLCCDNSSYHQTMKGDRQWCFENFVNFRTMETVVDTRNQLRDLCMKMGLVLESCGDNTVAYRQ